MKAEERRDSGLVGAAILTSGRLGQILLSLATVKILTTVLTPEEVGRTYLLVAGAGFVNLTLLAAPMQYVQRYFLDWMKAGSGGEAVVTVVLAHLACGIFGWIISWILTSSGDVHSDNALITCIVLGASVLTGLSSQAVILLNLTRSRITSVIVGLSSGLTSLLCSTGLVFFCMPTAEAWIGGLAVGSIAVSIIAFRLLHWRLGSSYAPTSKTVQRLMAIPREKLQSAWTFIWPIAINVGLYWFLSQGYRFSATEAIGTENLGRFAIAFAIGGMMVASAEGVISPWIKPLFYARAVNLSDQQALILWRGYIGRVLAVYMPLMAFATCAAPLLLPLLTAKQFHEVASLAFWGGIVESLRVIAGLVYEGAVVQRSTKRAVIPHVISVAIALSGAFYFGNLFGAAGVGLAMVLAYLSLIISLRHVVDRKIFSEVRMGDIRISALGASLVSIILISGFIYRTNLPPMFGAFTCVVAGTLVIATLVVFGFRLKWSIEPNRTDV